MVSVPGMGLPGVRAKSLLVRVTSAARVGLKVMILNLETNQ